MAGCSLYRGINWLVLRRAVALAFAIFLSLWLGVVSADFVVAQVEPDPDAARRPAINLTQAASQLGLGDLPVSEDGLAPTGAGVVVGHVEGASGDYAPQRGAASFEGVNFTLRSGPSKVNGHANATASVIYGPGGLAPGVSEVHCYSAQDWLGEGCLRMGTDAPPRREGPRVYTHSWISPVSGLAPFVLRRVDWLADRGGVLMVVGVDNGRTSGVPPLLASGYNVLSVGVWDGASSGGGTRVEGADRCKPDIVAPGDQSSTSTAAVTAVAARLLQAADESGVDHADRPEVIKAVLLAGADKPDDWRPKPGSPLDPHYGAGRVNARQSLAILAGGVSQDAVLSPMGWRYQTLGSRDKVVHIIELREAVETFSIALVWHRRIVGGQLRDEAAGETYWNNTALLPDFDLRVVSETDDGGIEMLGKSASLVDNVEHVLMRRLSAGRYALHINRKDTLAGSFAVAIAWHAK